MFLFYSLQSFGRIFYRSRSQNLRKFGDVKTESEPEWRKVGAEARIGERAKSQLLEQTQTQKYIGFQLSRPIIICFRWNTQATMPNIVYDVKLDFKVYTYMKEYASDQLRI